jgi:hypothetical protein
MGQTLTGGVSRKENVSMLTPEQEQLFSSLLTGLGPQAQQTLGGFLQPQSQQDMEATFQKAYVDPAMQTFEQKTIPAIQQRFVDANAGASSALNQALAQGASDLSTSIGSQFGQFQQGQQQQQLQALSQFLPLAGTQTFSPQFQQNQGILGALLQGAGQAGGAYMASSKQVKENIRDYKKSLNDLNKLNVKQYDYIKEFGGHKDRVGLIAEDVPEELTAEKSDILHVDLYGTMGLMINSIKELNKKVEKLEKR